VTRAALYKYRAAFLFLVLIDDYATVRPLLIIGVERDYLRGTICLVPSLIAVLYTSAVHMCTCVLSLCGREVV